MAETSEKPAETSEKPAELSEEAAESSKKAEPSKKQPMSISRRSLVIGVGSTVALLGMGSLRYVGHTPIKRPPGGQNESHLVSACIRCEKCYEACPRGIIKPAHIEDGLLGMRSPELNFNDNYCDFCVSENGGKPLCVTCCPTNALSLDGIEGLAENSVRIGYAVIDEHQCLAYRDAGCHYCADACPYQAISYLDNAAKEKALRPVVNTDLCNGCGACESVCVSLKTGSIVEGATERAITVKPLNS